MTATTTAISASFHHGPLPSPETLERYNEIIPNGAERIMAMAESQMRHRQNLETVVVTGNVQAQARGQNYALALGGLAIGGGILLTALGQSVEGLATVITALTAYSVVFFYARHQQRVEREQKRRELREAEAQQRLPLEDAGD